MNSLKCFQAQTLLIGSTSGTHEDLRLLVSQRRGSQRQENLGIPGRQRIQDGETRIQSAAADSQISKNVMTGEVRPTILSVIQR